MFYKKGVDITNPKSMFEFVSNHCKYYTMNAWNKCNSIANNVKLYNLPLKNDWSDVFTAIQHDEYFTVNQFLEDFASEHNCKIFFNGRSDGYLVIQSSILESSYCPSHYVTYDTWKEDVKSAYGSIKEYMPILVEITRLVQAFDKLCDNLVEVIDDLTNEYFEEQRRAKIFRALKVREDYEYESEEDRRLHSIYMKNSGYYMSESYEDNGRYYSTYEMNESFSDSVYDKGE